MEKHFPKIRFEGNDLANRAGIIFAEILKDLLAKIDYGNTPDYPRGFLHSSTEYHEIPPCYYHEMWARDAARGITELARFGFTDEALMISEYCLSQTVEKGYWGRRINKTGEKTIETDGNAGLLLALYNTWLAAGKDKELGKKYIRQTQSVLDFFEKTQQTAPYGFLAPSTSELSWNPDTPYHVYGIFPNYGLYYAAAALAEMADYCGEAEREPSVRAKRYFAYAQKLHAAMGEKLVSSGKNTLIPEGVWLNGIDGRDGSPYDHGRYERVSFPVYKSTRQIPFVQGFDIGRTVIDSHDHKAINDKSYQYLANEMCKGYFYRKYGFVSNTAWEGAADRHDDTMAGYGQNYFTQANLMQDDTNRYTKSLEGICRLAYDGDVVSHLAHEMNPWVMHECFTYENYEQGLDHTFGKKGNRERGIMENPGDEGNLVQSAETLKTFALACGLSYSGDTLTVAPRLPWEWTGVELMDYPVHLSDGSLARIDLVYKIERWRSRVSVKLKSDTFFKQADFRFGPFPRRFDFNAALNGFEKDESPNTTWLWKRNFSGKEIEIEFDYFFHQGL